jgi:hypothetical protein
MDVCIDPMEKPVQDRLFLDVMRVDAEQRILILIVALIALMSLGIGMMLPLTFPGLFF